MNGISHTEFKANVKSIMDKVFQEGQGWEGAIFQPSLSSRRILYRFDPSNYIEWENEKENDLTLLFWESLVRSAILLGDRGCYFSEVHQYQKEYNHAYVPLSELVHVFMGSPISENYVDIQIIDIGLNNHLKIYSESAKWGLYVYFEHFALLGGTPKFMETMENLIPCLENQTYNLLRDLKGDMLDMFDISQIRTPIERMLQHMYGSAKAEKLLRETGWY